MKTFIFTQSKTWSRSSGSNKVTAQVYRIKNNKPIHVLEVKWNTGSFKGETSAIMNELADKGIIQKKYSEGYLHDHKEKDFEIFEV